MAPKKKRQTSSSINKQMNATLTTKKSIKGDQRCCIDGKIIKGTSRKAPKGYKGIKFSKEKSHYEDQLCHPSCYTLALKEMKQNKVDENQKVASLQKVFQRVQLIYFC